MDESDAYCLFTRAGREQKAAHYLNYYTGLQAISPCRVMREKRQGQWLEVRRPMLPGYIFLYGLLLPEHISVLHDMGRIVRSMDNEYALSGGDYAYAQWVMEHGGVFGVSHVLCEGDHARVLDGPLKAYEGDIKRIDRHKRRATLQIRFDGHVKTVQLSIDELSVAEEGSGTTDASRTIP